MRKLFFVVIATFLIFVGLGADTPVYSVKGRVYFNKQGTIYVLLMEEGLFLENKGRQTPYQACMEIGPEKMGDEFGGFEIPHVPRGRYCLICFQDTNGNKKLDKGLFGPTEPWCIYNRPQGGRGRPQFKDIAFYVTKDISGVEIHLQ